MDPGWMSWQMLAQWQLSWRSSFSAWVSSYGRITMDLYVPTIKISTLLFREVSFWDCVMFHQLVVNTPFKCSETIQVSLWSLFKDQSCPTQSYCDVDTYFPKIKTLFCIFLETYLSDFWRQQKSSFWLWLAPLRAVAVPSSHAAHQKPSGNKKMWAFL